MCMGGESGAAARSPGSQQQRAAQQQAPPLPVLQQQQRASLPALQPQQASQPALPNAPVSMGMAKPMPEDAPLPVGSAIAVLMPIRRPRLSSSGPPAGEGGRKSGAGRRGGGGGSELRGPGLAGQAAVSMSPAAAPAAQPPTRVARVDGRVALDDVAQRAARVARVELAVQPADHACSGEATARTGGRERRPAGHTSTDPCRQCPTLLPKHPPVVSVWSRPKGLPAGQEHCR